MRGYVRFIEPLLSRLRRKLRLAQFEIRSIGDLANHHRVASTGAQQRSTCSAACGDLLEFHRASISKFFACARDDLSQLSGHATPMILKIDGTGYFQGVAGHSRYMQKRSKGSIARQIRRARNHYSCRHINRFAHLADIHNVDTSILFRTSGIMLNVLVERAVKQMRRLAGRADAQPEASHPLAALPPPIPPCSTHYAIDWGVFESKPVKVRYRAGDNLDTAAADEAAERAAVQKLAGYIFARRIGNGIRIVSILVHGDHLSAGAMKLLMYEFVQWVIAGEADYLKGIDYIHYGAAEHGGSGLLFWKTQFGFQPALFEVGE